MIKAYIKAVQWNLKNQARMTPKDWEDFRRLDGEFNEWARKLPEAEREVVYDNLRALSVAMRIFGPDSKIMF
jgi:hypothetical protein